MITTLTAIIIAFPVLSQGHAAAPAQAEVSAVKGPVKLTLGIHETRVKMGSRVEDYDYDAMIKAYAKHYSEGKFPPQWNDKYRTPVIKPINEPVWFRISVQNVGKKTGPWPGDIFNREFDFGKSLSWNARFKSGVYLEIIDPDGKPVELNYIDPRQTSGHPCPEAPILTDPDEIADAKVRSAQIEAWKKAGLTIAQINERLDDFGRKQEKGREERKWARHHKMRLKPGEKASTPTWHYQLCPGSRAHIQPPEDFAELFDYELVKTGIYRIRAIYEGRDESGQGDAEVPSKSPELYPGWGVRLRTPEIKIEVRP